MPAFPTEQPLRQAAKPLAIVLALGQSFADEPRVRLQVRGLARRYRVIGYGAAGSACLDSFRLVPLPHRKIHRLLKFVGSAIPQLRISLERCFYRFLAKELQKLQPEIVIANNPLSAWPAQMSGLPFVLDSQEYLPRQFDGDRLWRLTEIRYRRAALEWLLADASLLTVEGNEVERAYSKAYPKIRGKTRVVPNMPPYSRDLSPSHVSGEPFRLIHHGSLVPERGLELLIDVLAVLGERYELTFMGNCTDGKYLQQLKKRGAAAGNVVFRDAVPYESIVPVVNAYDLGLVFFGSRHFHHRFMTVPNKFWECLQARVPVVVSSESAMASYVRRTGCGVVAEPTTRDGFVRAIANLSITDIEAKKVALNQQALAHSQDAWIHRYPEMLSFGAQDAR